VASVAAAAAIPPRPAATSARCSSASDTSAGSAFGPAE
jgi:hypothetical protein